MANISKINNYDIKDSTARAAIDTINHSSNGVLARANAYTDQQIGVLKIPTIPSSLPANGGNADTVDNVHIVKLTKAQYEALGTKDSNTLYLITE